MLPEIVSDIVTDLPHELCALASHIQYLISWSIGSAMLTIAIIHRKSENAIGYKAVSEPGSYVDAFLRQHRKKEASEFMAPGLSASQYVSVNHRIWRQSFPSHPPRKDHIWIPSLEYRNSDRLYMACRRSNRRQSIHTRLYGRYEYAGSNALSGSFCRLSKFIPNFHKCKSQNIISRPVCSIKALIII